MTELPVQDDGVEKDMRLSPPMRAPKLQPAVGQSSTRECWNPPKKRYSMCKDKEEAAVRL